LKHFFRYEAIEIERMEQSGRRNLEWLLDNQDKLLMKSAAPAKKVQSSTFTVLVVFGLKSFV